MYILGKITCTNHIKLIYHCWCQFHFNLTKDFVAGCEVEILGVEPTFCEKYVSSPSMKNLTDAIENGLNVLK